MDRSTARTTCLWPGARRERCLCPAPGAAERRTKTTARQAGQRHGGDPVAVPASNRRGAAANRLRPRRNQEELPLVAENNSGDETDRNDSGPPFWYIRSRTRRSIQNKNKNYKNRLTVKLTKKQLCQ
nr:uncharacterized protein LOC117846814 [Setaria viridis]